MPERSCRRKNEFFICVKFKAKDEINPRYVVFQVFPLCVGKFQKKRYFLNCKKIIVINNSTQCDLSNDENMMKMHFFLLPYEKLVSITLSFESHSFFSPFDAFFFRKHEMKEKKKIRLVIDEKSFLLFFFQKALKILFMLHVLCKMS